MEPRGARARATRVYKHTRLVSVLVGLVLVSVLVGLARGPRARATRVYETLTLTKPIRTLTKPVSAAADLNLSEHALNLNLPGH